MKSTIGRPRTLTDRQVKIVLAWHARYLLWRALRLTLKPQRQLANELGVSQATISHAVHLQGRYKKPAPRVPTSKRARR